MASTYEPIATYTATGSIASYTFTSIPSTYTDLVLICRLATSGGNTNSLLELNGDTGTNYSETALGGSGSSATSARWSNQYGAYIDYYAQATTTVGDYMSIVNFNNYSNTTTYKTILARTGVASRGTDAIINTWRNTAAISSIKITNGSSQNILTGSTFTLYGIKAA